MSIYVFSCLFSSRVYTSLMLVGFSFLAFYYSGYKRSDELINIFKFNAIVYTTVLYLFFTLMKVKGLVFKFDDKSDIAINRGMNSFLAILIIVVLYKGYGVEIINTDLAFSYNKKAISNYHSNAFFKQVSEENGVIVSCPNCRHVQYLTKNPVLIEVDTMDDLSYFPSISSRFNEIMKDIYGYGFADRPDSWGNQVHIPENAIQELWEKRSKEDWKRLSYAYTFKGIITPIEWNLKLDITYKDAKYIYYRIEN